MHFVELGREKREMFEKPTVFILGAGASHPYGFPLGRDLVWDIIRRIEVRDNEDVRLFRDLDCTDRQMIGLASELRAADPPSIDDFLKRREDLRSLGKLAIANELMRIEGEGALSAATTEQWYRLLVAKITDRAFKDIPSSNVRIVSFNCDRS